MRRTLWLSRRVLRIRCIGIRERLRTSSLRNSEGDLGNERLREGGQVSLGIRGQPWSSHPFSHARTFAVRRSIMKFAVIVTLLFAMSLQPSGACSFLPVREFHVQPIGQSIRSPIPAVSVHRVQGVHRVPDSGSSCDGAGSLSLELNVAVGGHGAPADVGYYLLPLTGVDPGVQFPAFPIHASVVGGRPHLTWFWFDARPTTDGEFRWQLLLVPVSRHGRPGRPQVVCFSSDDSCPDSLIGRRQN